MAQVPATLDLCCIGETATLRDALQSLERSSTQLALITDLSGRLIGLMTDGDIRRAMLRTESLAAPVATQMRRDFRWVTPEHGRVEVLEMMHALRINGVPVLTPDRRLVGLHLLHDLVGAETRPNACILMAGGRGTRLAPLTKSVPKPMIRVAGRPILERLILHLVGEGFRRMYIAINYLGDIVERHFEDGGKYGCEIRYLRETKSLGTAGALSLVDEKLEHPVLVLNGDLVTQVSAGRLMDAHTERQAHITVGLKQYVHTVPYGCVTLEQGRITAMVEKPTLVQLANAGVYALEPTALGAVPKDTEFQMTDLIADAIARGEHVAGFEIEEDWIDVGQRDQLQQARGEL